MWLSTIKFIKRNIVAVLITLFFISFFILALLSPKSYGGADDLVHFRFAYYSFKYPQLLLDHWAKPVFTIFASPFAQLGYWGVKFFNLLTGSFVAYLVYRISGLLKIKRPELVIIFLFFTPVYTTMIMSGMTEVLFSAVLTYAAFLFLTKNYFWSAVVISLLPLVRTEGIIMWPLYIIGFIMHKKWKVIPFMLSTSIIYSIVGGLYFKDYFWLITHIPYTGTYDIYGHGKLLHFVNSNKLIFGTALTALFIFGLIATFPLPFIRRFTKEPLKTGHFDEIIVILAPLLLYYASHSFVWWKGINSLGLIRVMAGVAPLFVIYSLRGINLILDNISIKLRGIVLILTICFITITPFIVYEIPLKLSDKDQLILKAANWYRFSEYKTRKYYIWDSFFYHILNTNPYDSKKMGDGIPDRSHPEKFVKPGEIVIWDAHFSAVDGRFPLNAILDNPYYKLIKVFRPKKSFFAGGGVYQLCFFERLDTAMNLNNRSVLDSLLLLRPVLKESILLKKNFKDSKNTNGIDIAGNMEFYMFKQMVISKKSWNEGDELHIKLSSTGDSMFLVVSTGGNSTLEFYRAFQINIDSAIREYSITLPEIKKNKQMLKVYMWNPNNNKAHILQSEIKLLRQ